MEAIFSGQNVLNQWIYIPDRALESQCLYNNWVSLYVSVLPYEVISQAEWFNFNPNMDKKSHAQ